MDILCSSVPRLIVGRPKASSAAYAVVTAIGYQHPYAFDDLVEQAQVIQGASPAQLTKEQLLHVLDEHGTKYIDEQHLVDSGTALNDYTELRHELASLGRNEYIILITLKNDKTLALANSDGTQGQTLHAWSTGVPYTLVRCGFSDSAAYGFYQDALLSSLPLPTFIPVLWSDITACGIDSVLAIAPSRLAELPPPSFRYFGGIAADGSLLPDNIWPVPVQSLDAAPIIASVQQVLQASNQSYSDEITALNTRVNVLNASKQQSDVAFLDILHKLGLKDAPMQQSVL